jgi:outer membrane protein, multidrug efflux system
MSNTPPSASDASARSRILSAAEKLVAEKGFESVSLRDITQEAGVNLAAVNYYFGGRDRLMDDMVCAVMMPVFKERLNLLDEVELAAGKRSPSVERLVDAFLRPMMNAVKRSAQREQLFHKFLGRCLSERGSTFPEAILPTMGHSLERVSRLLNQALPKLSVTEIIWRLNFTAGAMMSTLIHGETIRQFAKEKQMPAPDALLERMVVFCAAGMKANGVMKPTTKKKRTAQAAKVAVLLCGLFLTACDTPVAPSRMEDSGVEVPKSWAATREARAGVDDAWLARFGDSKLTALVNEAENNSPNLKAALSRIEQARGLLKSEGAAGNPSADLTFQPVRSKRNFIGFPIFGSGGGSEGGVQSNHVTQFDLGMPVNWELDVWGRIKNARTAALAGVQAAEADQQAARLSLAAEVARVYFALTEAQGQLALAREAEKTFAETATAVKERFKGGAEQVGMAAQVRLAESDTATAKAAAEERNQLIATLSRQLEVLIGRYPSGSLKGASSMPALPGKPPAGLPSELLLRRPDIIAAERRLSGHGFRIKEAWKALYPRFKLTTNIGTSTTDLKDVLNSDFGVWQLAGNVIQPLFSGGLVRAEISTRYGKEKELAAQLQKTVLKACSEVETALAIEQDLARREAAVSEAASLAEEALKAANADYRDGVGDMLTVLTAQSRAVSARSQRLAIKRARLENRIALHLALGGDYKAHGVPSAAPTSATPASAITSKKPLLSLFKRKP